MCVCVCVGGGGGGRGLGDKVGGRERSPSRNSCLNVWFLGV